MKLVVKDNQGQPAGELEVGFALVEDGRGTQAVHDYVVAHLANRRSGTASTKTMGEVAGSGKKPWRQKGTGRARAGSFQSPLWVGGGITFGPKPRDFGKKVPKTARTLALRKAMSERLKAGDVVLVDDLKLASHKTKEFIALLQALELADKKVLVVCQGGNRELSLASRNVPGIAITTGRELNTYQTLCYDKLLFTRPAFAQVEERLK